MFVSIENYAVILRKHLDLFVLNRIPSINISLDPMTTPVSVLSWSHLTILYVASLGSDSRGYRCCRNVTISIIIINMSIFKDAYCDQTSECVCGTMGVWGFFC